MDNLEMMTADVVLFVQINDVYHIDFRADYSDDKSMILPRVATAIKRLRSHFGKDRVRFCLPGDFLGPSCLSREFKGAQMVAVLNAMGLDFVTFGNHEFEEDFSARDILNRMDESQYTWVCSNFEFFDEAIFKEFLNHPRFSDSELIDFSDGNTIELIGVLYESEYSHIGRSLDPITQTRKLIEEHKEVHEELRAELGRRVPEVTFVAMTHQLLAQDIEFAEKSPEIRLVMGGHDHDVRFQETTHSLIVKTVSNARTLRLNWLASVPCAEVDALMSQGDARAVRERISKQLLRTLGASMLSVMIFGKERPTPDDNKLGLAEYLTDGGFFDNIRVGSRRSGDEEVFVFSLAVDTMLPKFIELIPEDPDVRSVIDHWLAKAHESSTPIVWAPAEMVLEDKIVRRKSTNFGNLAADIVRGHLPFGAAAKEAPAPPADVGLINSGGFRLDRTIRKGEGISQKTLCDIFFHKNAIHAFELTGAELLAILGRSVELLGDSAEEGHGDFLQLSGLVVEVRGGRVESVHWVSTFGQHGPLDLMRTYSVATTTYVSDKSQSYKEFFAGKQARPMAADLKGKVEASLQDFREMDESGVPLLAALLDERPRWIWR